MVNITPLHVVGHYLYTGVYPSDGGNHCKSHEQQFNSLPDDKILDWFKLKQIADDILKCI